MNRPPPPDHAGRAELAEYFREAESWSADRERAAASSRRTAWIVAGVASAIALAEAVAIMVMVPLKREVPYTLLVDRQTGHVQALKPFDQQMIAPDEALVRSFLAQYVIAREGFDRDSLQNDYRKVALWSAGEARERYIAGMQSSNPSSPLSLLPGGAAVAVEVSSISSLASRTALVRFTTRRSDPGGQSQPVQHWAAVLRYRFSGDAMSAADRLVNPLGFQVLRYRRDAETIPADPPAVAAVAPPAPSPRVPVAEGAR